MINKNIVNGIQVKTELNKNDKLVSVCYKVNVGSHNETEDILGIAHLVEHLVFKGTDKRNSEQINQYIEGLGGYMNAFTSFEETEFYCTLPSEYWKEAIDFINDLVFFNTIPEDEFELEKGVVLNELRMYSDDPVSVCQDNLFKIMFHKDITKQLVGGTVETVSKITREDVINFIDNNYINKHIDIIITGNIEGSEEDLYEYIESITPETDNDVKLKDKNYDFEMKERKIEAEKSDISQSILCWALIGPAPKNEDYIPFYLAVNALGGNASSILYSNVREKLGLVYTISFRMEEFTEYTVANGHTSLQKENIEKVMDIIEKETKNLKIDEKTLESNKNFLIGDLLMGLEKTIDRNNYISEFDCESDEMIEKIKKVTVEDVERVITKYFNSDIYYSLVTPKE
jgi:predicted Zn-dependent peptidase